MLFSPFDDSEQSWISSRPSSPAMRAKDISRILDPSYSSPSSSSSQSPTAYVDIHGELHDPDYRDFPTLPSLSPKRSHTSRSTTPCHSLTAAAYHATRPTWDRSDLMDDALSDRDDAYADDDDDEDDDLYCDSPSRCSRRSSIRSALHTRHNHLYHQYHPRDYRQSYTAYVHSSPEPSPPTSLDSALPEHSDHFCHDDRERLRKQSRSKSTHKSNISEKLPPSLLFDAETLPEADETRGAADGEYVDNTGPAKDKRDPEWTPTCTEAMRRQWQAISLRFRFGVFRARREVRRRITGG